MYKGQILTNEERDRIWPQERRDRFSILCKQIRPKGNNSPAWKDGKSMNNGRIMVHNPTHPRTCKNYKYVFEHVLVAEKALNKLLPPKAKIHHIDGNSTNNNNDNLVVCQDQAYHMLLHVRQRLIKAGVNPSTPKVCPKCKQTKTFAEFTRKEHTCRACIKIRYKAKSMGKEINNIAGLEYYEE